MSRLFRLLPVLLFIAVVTSLSQTAESASLDRYDAWSGHQDVVVQEQHGYARMKEPVETEFQYALPLSGGIDAIPSEVKREIRVVRLTGDNDGIEIPCQAYDVRPATPRSKDQKTVAVRARVVFMADIEAYGTNRYRIYYGNPSAQAPEYDTGLTVSGSGVGYTIENEHYRIITEEQSGQIDQIDVKFATQPSLRFKYGTLHWNPDFIVVPDDHPATGYTWYYAHHFDKPEVAIENGPLFFDITRKQLIPGQDTAYMEVHYRFYAGLPYFISETHIEAMKDCRTFAIRNDELAFGRTDFTHALWRNKTPDMLPGHEGEIGGINIFHEERAGGHVLGSVLPPNMAWISLCNPENGYGVGSIRLWWDNTNALTGEPSPTYNSHTVISEHDEGLYWFRSQIYSPRGAQGVDTDTLLSFLIDVPKGSCWRERNAYIIYPYTGEERYTPIDDRYYRLSNPLDIQKISE